MQLIIAFKECLKWEVNSQSKYMLGILQKICHVPSWKIVICCSVKHLHQFSSVPFFVVVVFNILHFFSISDGFVICNWKNWNVLTDLATYRVNGSSAEYFVCFSLYQKCVDNMKVWAIWKCGHNENSSSMVVLSEFII